MATKEMSQQMELPSNRVRVMLVTLAVRSRVTLKKCLGVRR